MHEFFGLDGRVALITGSSRGIGLTLATGLANAGARVIIHGRDIAALKTQQQELASTGLDVDVAAFDLTDAKAVHRGVEDVCNQVGAPDILVNNAGMQLRAPIEEFTVEQWHSIIDTNLTSAFLMAQAVVPGMVKRGRGKIINIASIQSQLARPSITPYAASKGGIVMLTRGLCADLGKHNIQCNALAPGYFATELTKDLVDDEVFSDWVCDRTPAARWGKKEDLVGTCIYLASDASRFVNGQVIFVDGGMSAVV